MTTEGGARYGCDDTTRGGSTSSGQTRSGDPSRTGFSRRRFLQGAGGAAAGTVLAGAAQEAMVAAAEVGPAGFVKYESAGAEISLAINGKPTPLKVTPQTTLLHAVRESLGLTGAKEVCDRGAAARARASSTAAASTAA